MNFRNFILAHLECRVWLVGLGMVFRFLLEVSYRDFVVPWYESAGFTLVDNRERYAESWVLFVALLLLLPSKIRRPSDLLICLTFFSYLAPLLIFYGLADKSRWALYFVLIQYSIMVCVTLGRPIRLPVIASGPTLAWWVVIAGVVFVTSWMIAAGGLTTFNLDLDAVYDFREDAGNVLNVGFMSYLVVWVPAVCGPLLLMRALRNRQRTLALCIVLLHVFWFGITSHKAVLFFPALVLFLHVVLKRSRAMALIPLAMAFVVLVSLLSYYATESLFVSGMFVRRVFFVPSRLTFTYFEFFDQNPLVYWSNSVLSPIVSYPYDQSVALTIGTYLNEPNAWANNSFFSTGFMHAGFLGVVVYGLAAGAVLKLLDSISSTAIPLHVSLSIVIVPFFTLVTSADLTTALMTHGLGFAIFMLYLMKVSRGPRGRGGEPVTTAATGGPFRAFRRDARQRPQSAWHYDGAS